MHSFHAISLIYAVFYDIINILLNTQRKQYFYLVAVIINSFNLLKDLLFYSLFKFHGIVYFLHRRGETVAKTQLQVIAT